MGLIKSCIQTALLTEPSKKWPTFDGKTLLRHQYVTASEAGRCVRELSFNKNHELAVHTASGGAADQDYWANMPDHEFALRVEAMTADTPFGIFARGNNIEAWIVEQLRAAATPDEMFMFLGDEQVSFHTSAHKVSGTPDGMHIDFTDKSMRLLEFKSTNSIVTRPKPAHVTQVLVNMGIIKLLLKHKRLDPEKYSDLYMCENNFDTGVLAYVLADNYLQVDEFEIPWDGGDAYNKAAKKATALFLSGQDGKLTTTLKPPAALVAEGLETNGCRFCEHKRACYDIEQKRADAAHASRLQKLMDEAEGRVVPTLPTFASDAPIERIMSAVLDYDKWAQVEKDAEQHKKAMRDAIVEWVKLQKGCKVDFKDEGRNIKVSVTTSSRESMDKERLAARLQEIGDSIDAYMAKGADFDTLRVSVK